MVLTFYACPAPGCGSYYGSTNMGDLSKSMTGGRGPNGEFYEGREHPRARCPDCFARTGAQVERVLVTAEIETPALVAAA